MSRPQGQLRSKVIKNALKAFIVPALTLKFQVCAVRALWDDKINIWSKRRQLEEILNKDTRVVAFFSCITALEVAKKKAKKAYRQRESDPFTSTEEEESDAEVDDAVKPGLAFWIVFDCPEIGILAFESDVTKRFLSAGLDISNCKAVKGRGML